MNAQNKEKNFRLCRWKVEKVRCSFFWDIFQVLPVTLRSLSCWKLTLLCHDSASSSLALLASSSRVILALYSANSAACGVERQKKKSVKKAQEPTYLNDLNYQDTVSFYEWMDTQKKKKSNNYDWNSLFYLSRFNIYYTFIYYFIQIFHCFCEDFGKTISSTKTMCAKV